MTFEEAARRADGIAAALESMATAIDAEPGLRQLAGTLRARAAQTREDRFRVLILGEFKRGKSTLLNAVLGSKVLPAKVAPCTAVITVIGYGPEPRVRVSFLGGRADEVLSVDEFRRRYELKAGADDAAEDLDRFADVDRAVVEYPLELCRNRVEFVDSPGLGEHAVRTRRTEGFLASADAVVFVLDATQLLTEEECHFLDVKLLPRGLRNIFFAVNKWDVIAHQVLDPADADDHRREVDERIRQKLSPFCLVDGVDLAERRIFRVNSLGALKGRLAGPAGAAQVAESRVPALETALQEFLVADRERARSRVMMALVRSSVEDVGRYVGNQVALAARPAAEVEAERAALQPKLDRLGGIRDHLARFLREQSALLQDRLVQSLRDHTSKLEKSLPEEVDKFDLTPIIKWPLWDALTDKFRDEENRFEAKLRRCLQPQVERVVGRHFAEWKNAILGYEIKTVTMDIDKHLQAEAAEYVRVMSEIEERVGFHCDPPQVKDQVARWLGVARPEAIVGPMPTLDVLRDVAGIVAGGLAVDVLSDVMFHTATLGIGIVVAIGLAFWRLQRRNSQLKERIREKTVEAVGTALRDMGHQHATKLRDEIKSGFAGLERTIVGNMDAEIAIVRGALDEIVAKKKSIEFSAAAEAERLEAVRAAVGRHAGELRSLLATA